MARRGINPTNFKLLNSRPVTDTALIFKLISITKVRDLIRRPPEITALDVKLMCIFARMGAVSVKLGDNVKYSTVSR